MKRVKIEFKVQKLQMEHINENRQKRRRKGGYEQKYIHEKKGEIGKASNEFIENTRQTKSEKKHIKGLINSG